MAGNACVDDQRGIVPFPITEGERNDSPVAKSSSDYLAQIAIDYRDHSQVGLPGLGITALLGPEDRGLLLRLAHEYDPLGALESGVVLLGDVILALSLGEGDQGDLFLDDQALDRGDERFADGIHEGRRGKGITTVVTEEGRDAAVGLQPGLVDIEVHAVDAFDLESNVFAEDFGDGPW